MGIIITMPRAEDAERIRDLLANAGVEDYTFICKTGASVLASLRERDADIVICTKKLSDMGYEEIVEYMPSYAHVILLTKDSSFVTYSSNVLKVSMPFRTGDLLNTLSMIRGPLRLKKKKPKPERSVEEKKVIDKAKQILMERNGMSEPDAFRYIQKVSMDTGRNMLECAQMILMLNDE